MATSGPRRFLARLGCLGLLFSLGMIFFGCRQAWRGAFNRRPTTLSYADYLEKKPDAYWLHLTGTRLTLLDAIWRERFGDIKELYLPVRPEKGKGDGRIHVLVRTSDPTLIARAEKLRDRTKDAKNRAQLLLALAGMKLAVELEVKGVLTDSLSDKLRGKLEKTESKLAEDYIVLDHGEEPHLTAGLLFSILGLALAVGACVFMSRLADDDEEEKAKGSPPRAVPVIKAVDSSPAQPASAADEVEKTE
jgi:hypothetical protein